MPFEIVRNDIVNMNTDAIVCPANPMPAVGRGTDFGIHRKGGAKLLEARRKIGKIPVGEARMTMGYQLPAKYVIHAVSPLWQGGSMDEVHLLETSYENALNLAAENGCRSVAFPLLASGTLGFPGEIALHTAVRVFSKFLLDHEMQVYLVVFDQKSYTLSSKLFQSVKSYIDENYVQDILLEEKLYTITLGSETCSASAAEWEGELARECKPEHKREGEPKPEWERERGQHLLRENSPEFYSVQTQVGSAPSPMSSWDDNADANDDDTAERAAAFRKKKISAPSARRSLSDLMDELEESFSQSLFRLIDARGMKDSDVYKAANMSRQHFSKIRNNPNYRPSKNNAIALAIALELNLDETKDFIGRAGYALTHSSKVDIIVEYFIEHGNYNIIELNEVLFAFEQPLIA